MACTYRDQHVQRMYETWETQTKEQSRESFADVCLEADSLLAMNRNLNMTFNQTQKDFIVEFVVDGVVK